MEESKFSENDLVIITHHIHGYETWTRVRQQHVGKIAVFERVDIDPPGGWNGPTCVVKLNNNHYWAFLSQLELIYSA